MTACVEGCKCVRVRGACACVYAWCVESRKKCISGTFHPHPLYIATVFSVSIQTLWSNMYTVNSFIRATLVHVQLQGAVLRRADLC